MADGDKRQKLAKEKESMKAVIIFIAYVLIGVMAIIGFAWIILKTLMTECWLWVLSQLGIR